MFESDKEIIHSYGLEVFAAIARNPSLSPWEAAANFAYTTALGPLVSSSIGLDLLEDQQQAVKYYATLAAESMRRSIADYYQTNPLAQLDLDLFNNERELDSSDTKEYDELSKVRNIRTIFRKTQSSIKAVLQKGIEESEVRGDQLTTEEILDQILAAQKPLDNKKGYFLMDFETNYGSQVDFQRKLLGVPNSIYEIREQNPNWRESGAEAFNLTTSAPGVLAHIRILRHTTHGEGWVGFQLSLEREAVEKVALTPTLPSIIHALPQAPSRANFR